jgi:hypothetical protein
VGKKQAYTGGSILKQEFYLTNTSTCSSNITENTVGLQYEDRTVKIVKKYHGWYFEKFKKGTLIHFKENSVLLMIMFDIQVYCIVRLILLKMSTRILLRVKTAGV